MEKHVLPIKIEQLKIFSSKDAVQIRNLILQLGSNFQTLNDRDFKEILNSSSTYLLVARDYDKNIIGMITLAVYRIPYLRKGYIDDVIADRKYRGMGVGSKLLMAAIDKAKNLGAAYVDLTSSPDRLEGNKLYKKFGFKKRNTNYYRFSYDNKKTQ